MKTTTEKLTDLRAQLEPTARQMLEQSSGQMGMVAKAAMGMVLPQVEEWLDRQLQRPDDELDAAIAGLIDTLGRLRSDTAVPLIATAAGAHVVEYIDGGNGGIAIGHPVRAEGVHHGVHPDGQEHAGA